MKMGVCEVCKLVVETLRTFVDSNSTEVMADMHAGIMSWDYNLKLCTGQSDLWGERGGGGRGGGGRGGGGREGRRRREGGRRRRGRYLLFSLRYMVSSIPCRAKQRLKWRRFVTKLPS